MQNLPSQPRGPGNPKHIYQREFSEILSMFDDEINRSSESPVRRDAMNALNTTAGFHHNQIIPILDQIAMACDIQTSQEKNVKGARQQHKDNIEMFQLKRRLNELQNR